CPLGRRHPSTRRPCVRRPCIRRLSARRGGRLFFSNPGLALPTPAHTRHRNRPPEDDRCQHQQHHAPQHVAHGKGPGPAHLVPQPHRRSAVTRDETHRAYPHCQNRQQCPPPPGYPCDHLVSHAEQHRDHPDPVVHPGKWRDHHQGHTGESQLSCAV